MAKEGKKKDKAAKPSGGSNDYGLAGPGSSAPSDEDRFNIGDHVNQLLLVTPRQKKEVTTEYGTNEVVEADVVALDKADPANSKDYPGAWIFAAIVQNQLAEAMGKGSRVVGTLILDEAMKKPGKSAPYRLTAPTDQDIDVAKRYLDSLDPLR